MMDEIPAIVWIFPLLIALAVARWWSGRRGK